MSMMKKWIALLLSLCMALMTLPALAEVASTTETTEESPATTEAAEAAPAKATEGGLLALLKGLVSGEIKLDTDQLIARLQETFTSLDVSQLTELLNYEKLSELLNSEKLKELFSSEKLQAFLNSDAIQTLLNEKLTELFNSENLQLLLNSDSVKTLLNDKLGQLMNSESMGGLLGQVSGLFSGEGSATSGLSSLVGSLFGGNAGSGAAETSVDTGAEKTNSADLSALLSLFGSASEDSGSLAETAPDGSGDMSALLGLFTQSAGQAGTKEADGPEIVPAKAVEDFYGTWVLSRAETLEGEPIDLGIQYSMTLSEGLVTMAYADGTTSESPVQMEIPEDSGALIMIAGEDASILFLLSTGELMVEEEIILYFAPQQAK